MRTLNYTLQFTREGISGVPILLRLVLFAVVLVGRDTQATTLTADQVAQAAYGVGFRGSALVNAIAVADAESGFVLEAINSNTNGTVDRGLWQINSIHSEYDPSLLTNSASYNASAAYNISEAASDANWTPWVTFNNGAFTSYLAVARNAAQNVDSTVIRGVNDKVSATTALNVRTNAGGGFSRAVAANTTGTLLAGPVVAVIGSGTYSFVWWKIHWDDGGSDGWSTENYIARRIVTSNFLVSGETVMQVSFPTRDSYQYQVSSSPDMTNWTPATGIVTACGGSESFTFPITNGQGFYLAQEFPPDLSKNIIGVTNVFLDTARLTSQGNQMTIGGMRVQSRDYNFNDYVIATYSLDLCKQSFDLQQLDVITNVGATCGTSPLFFLKDATNSLVMSNGATAYFEGTTYSGVVSTGQTMTVDMSSAQVLQIVVASATAKLTLIALDPGGNQIYNFIIPDGGTWYNGNFNAFKPGRYSFRFAPYNTGTVSFTLRFRNLNRRATTFVNSGGTIGTSLEDYYYDYAKYAISASAGQTLWITNTPGGSQALTVCNSRGIGVGALQGGGTGTPLIVPISSSDTYTILYYHVDFVAHSGYSSRVALTP
jgi:hypothetical protein